MSLAGRASAHGTSVTITHTSAATYDTSTGTATGTVTNYTVKGTLRKYRTTELNDTIREDDRELMVPADQFVNNRVPGVDDAATIDGAVWQIHTNPSPITKLGRTTHYLLHIRRHT